MNDPDVQADELAWVEFTERGAAQVNSGQLAAAEDNWQRAGAIAERFPEGDPRHAASTNNLGVLARMAERLDDADRLYKQALQAWVQTCGWVERMQLAPRARSSLFHMRLEQSHRDHFARWALDEYYQHLPRGAATTLNNRAEWCQYTGDRSQASALYCKALDKYDTTLDAPAPGAEAISRNLAFCEPAEMQAAVGNTQRAVWAPALAQPFRAHAEREGWIIDRPPEFTDEGRFMAGLMLVCLIEQTQPAASMQE